MLGNCSTQGGDVDSDGVCDSSDACAIANDADFDCLRDDIDDPCPNDLGNKLMFGHNGRTCACSVSAVDGYTCTPGGTPACSPRGRW